MNELEDRKTLRFCRFDWDKSRKKSLNSNDVHQVGVNLLERHFQFLANVFPTKKKDRLILANRSLSFIPNWNFQRIHFMQEKERTKKTKQNKWNNLNAYTCIFCPVCLLISNTNMPIAIWKATIKRGILLQCFDLIQNI